MSLKQFFTRRLTVPMWGMFVVVLVALAIGRAGGEADETENVVTQITSSTTSSTRPSTTSTAPATTTTVPTTTTTTRPKSWQPVTTLSGTSEKRGPDFTLTGADARLRYESKAGAFFTYVVDSGDSLEKSGGTPEASCTNPCSDSTILKKDAGSYYLDVKASGGAWTVVIEEYR